MKEWDTTITGHAYSELSLSELTELLSDLLTKNKENGVFSFSVMKVYDDDLNGFYYHVKTIDDEKWSAKEK